MSRSIWLMKTFSKETVAQAHDAFCWCARGGLPYDRAVSLVTYYLERLRQSGSGGANLADVMAGAERSGWRFMTGKNAQNYRAVGLRLLEAARELVGGAEGTPPEVLWDMLVDANPPGASQASPPPALRWLRSKITKQAGSHIYRVTVYTSVCGTYVIESHYGFLLTANGQFVPSDHGYHHGTLLEAKEAAEQHAARAAC